MIVPARIAKSGMKQPGTADRLETKLTAIVPHASHIHRRICLVNLSRIGDIFAIAAIKTFVNIFAVFQIVPPGIFALKLIEMLHGETLFDLCSIYLPRRRETAVCPEPIAFENLVIFLGRIRLIKDIVLFMPQITGKKTIPATFEIHRKKRVLRILATIHEDTTVAVFGKQTFITLLALIEPQIIETILVFGRIPSIQTVFFVMIAKREVTIFIGKRIIAIIAILRLFVDDRQTRYSLDELLKLGEKRLLKVVWPAVLQRIPIVRPVAFLAIYRKRSLGRI